MKKTALITGGSSGLGFAFAKLLGAAGYEIVILARNRERIDKALCELEALNIRAAGFACDVSDELQLQQTVAAVRAKHPTLDFLILNAGVVTTKLLRDYIDPAEIRKDLEIDLLGVIFSAHFFAPLLKRGGRILMVSSGFGLMGAAGYSVYCAAKAGIVNFAESLRRELLAEGVNVYVACPGDMDTPQFENEIRNQPAWLRQSSPRKVIPVDLAAARILKKCTGKYRLIVLSSLDVALLALATKLLPRSLRELILDTALPRPKKSPGDRG
jgi:NAD(P)-dependent dehydrogenase (short-subunit alcohol dehydrogenase family)